jgi:hypothetical protein
VAHGAYGIYYDRPFDNLWQTARNNSFTLASFDYRPTGGGYLSPVADQLATYQGVSFPEDPLPLTLFQQDWKSAYSQNWFVGVRRRLRNHVQLDITGVGALGRRLVTTDIVNRAFSLPASEAGSGNSGRYYNPALSEISYRGTQGSSNYHGLSISAHWRGPRAVFQAAYTWSHAIDNQSEPLTGDFFDLRFTRPSPVDPTRARSAFSRQFDSSADRGSSDFDQRHNFVVYSMWDLPSPFERSFWSALFRGWKVSQVAAFRTGFPYSVLAPSGVPSAGGSIVNNRANLADPRALSVAQAEVPGGYLTLSRNAFAEPTAGVLGDTGRNAFPGPGLFNIDCSVSRSIPLSRRESVRLLLRADIFNVLNHANLNPPDSQLGSQTFGVALFGRRGRDTGFPALIPFQETARQVQFILRLEF